MPATKRHVRVFRYDPATGGDGGFQEFDLDCPNESAMTMLDVLLHLSGEEQRIKADHLWAWSAVATWDPEARYKPVGRADLIEVVVMLSAAETLMDIL